MLIVAAPVVKLAMKLAWEPTVEPVDVIVDDVNVTVMVPVVDWHWMLPTTPWSLLEPARDIDAVGAPTNKMVGTFNVALVHVSVVVPTRVMLTTAVPGNRKMLTALLKVTPEKLMIFEVSILPASVSGDPVPRNVDEVAERAVLVAVPA